MLIVWRLLGQVCLLEQRYLLDDAATVGQVVAQQGQAVVGAPLCVRQFVRVQVGEGLEQSASPDFASEVSALAGST